MGYAGSTKSPVGIVLPGEATDFYNPLSQIYTVVEFGPNDTRIRSVVSHSQGKFFSVAWVGSGRETLSAPKT